MKGIVRASLLLMVVAVMMSSCGKTLPTVGFSVSPGDAEIYEEVFFTNITVEADSYEWDFGDGTTSTEVDPVHVYKTAGTYKVSLLALNADGEAEETMDVIISDHVNSYMLDDVEYLIDDSMFWYQSGMGGDPYIRLLTSVSGQDNPDLLKLYPNKGLNELPGSYTWDAENPAGTYDAGYTANYAGMAYDWTAIGKTGSETLTISEVDPGIYKISAEIVLSIGSYDFETGLFTETSTADLELDYLGEITPLP